PESYYRENTIICAPIFPDPVCEDCFWFACLVPGQWRLFSFNGTKKTFSPVVSDSLPPGAYIWDLVYDDDTAWFVTSAGLRPFDLKTRTFTGFEHFPEDFKKLRRKALTCAMKIRPGLIWVATATDGVYVLDKTRGCIAHYRHDPADPASLGSNDIQALLYDRSGTFWAGANGKGLNRIVPTEQRFYNFYLNPASRPALQDNSANAFLERRGDEIWIASDNAGLFLFDPSTRQLQQAGQRYPALDSLNTVGIFAACATPDGQLWFGANGHGLLRFDPRKNTLQKFRNDPSDSSSLGADYVSTLLSDRAGRLWAGTFHGLDRFDPQSGRFEHYYAVDPSKPANLFLNHINCLYEDQHGNIWAGVSNGLALFDPALQQFHYVLQAAGHAISKIRRVNAIYRDGGGVLWAGAGDGLYRVVFPDPANPRAGTPKIRRYTEAEGLPHQAVFSISQDSRGRLWINTRRGLSLFRNPLHGDKQAPDFKNFGVADGLQNGALEQAALFKSKTGLLFVGGQTGFDLVYPDSINDDTFLPPVRITALEKYDMDQPDAGVIAERGVSVRGEVELSYKNNIFSIEFAALDFREPANNRYAYRLLGFNDNWVRLGAQRRVTFTNLPPGEYTFEVRGANSDGVWNETPASLRIVVTPPWWKTIWAYLAYTLLFIAGVFAFIRARVRYLENRTRELEKAVALGTAQILEQKEKLEKQAGELRELDRLKTRFYANVTHELRTPLTLMLGPLHSVLKNWRGDLEHFKLLGIVRENGQKLLDLISELLDLGKLDANRMTLEYRPVAIGSLLGRLVAQFDSHAQYLGIRLNCQCDLPAERVVRLDAKKFATVLNNLLSNALKFTPAGGGVQVELSEQAGKVLLAVRDTGPGIHPDDLPYIFDRYFQTKRADAPLMGGTGIGLALCAELTRLCGGRIWAESSLGAGSVFWVEWPALQAETPGGSAEPAWEMELPQKSKTRQASFDIPESDPVRTGAGPADSPVRILVAEDNPDLQSYLRHLLAPEYDVILTRNGEEALAALNNVSRHTEKDFRDGVDLIISDIMMPRLDGFQLLERLKNDDHYRHIPLIMLTARTDIRDKLRALRAGVDDYLTKPFDEEELLARVRNLVRRQKSRQEAVAGQEVEYRLSRADAEWLSHLETWTRANLHDEFLSVSAMARQAALSERQLLRRMRELTGLSPQQYIGEMRLQQARETLEQGAFHTVAEAAYAAGFGNAKAFTRAYRERFGRLPSSYF
ncbi:MAG: response regulator, partial [Thermoanaerobaculia bacterium]|nr:response regulator [Thermoanaerobaculia bacterium]